MIAPDSRYIQEIDDLLTLDGLRILFERNRATRPRGRSSMTARTFTTLTRIPAPRAPARRKLSAVSSSALRSLGKDHCPQSRHSQRRQLRQSPSLAPRPTIAPSVRSQIRPARLTRR